MLAVLATCLLAPIEIAGVALVIPLLDLLSGVGSVDRGAAGAVANWTGVRDPDHLALLLGGTIVALFALRAVGTLLVRWVTLGILATAERDVAVRLLRGYLKEPYERHLSRNSAEVLRTLQVSVDQTFGGYVASSLSMFTETLVGLSIIGLLLIVQPFPTLVLAAYFALAGLLYVRVVQRRAYSIGTQMQSLSRQSILVARDALDGVKEISVLQRAAEFIRRYEAVRAETAGARRSMQFLREAPRYIIEIMFLIGVALLLGVLARTGSPEDTIPALGFLVAAGFRLMPPLGRLISAHTGMRSAAAAVEVAIGELERLEVVDHDRPAQPERPVQFSRELRFDGVTFRHATANRPSLANVTLSIVPGESVAIVGPSGAGKTTLVDLILGLHIPTAGRLAVDDVPLEECLRSWRSLVGYVPQDVFLIDASLRENIALGVPPADIDDDAVRRAIASAQLSGLVAQLDHGLDSEVGERGMRLSGGQRQRIGIARALYGAPRVLILDEATSALDSETETRISETIAELRSRMTVIAIAHRLSTLRDFGRVLFLRDGNLVGDGSFAELRRGVPEFALLLEQANLDLTPR